MNAVVLTYLHEDYLWCKLLLKPSESSCKPTMGGKNDRNNETLLRYDTEDTAQCENVMIRSRLKRFSCLFVMCVCNHIAAFYEWSTLCFCSPFIQPKQRHVSTSSLLILRACFPSSYCGATPRRAPTCEPNLANPPNLKDGEATMWLWDSSRLLWRLVWRQRALCRNDSRRGNKKKGLIWTDPSSPSTSSRF